MWCGVVSGDTITVGGGGAWDVLGICMGYVWGNDGWMEG